MSLCGPRVSLREWRDDDLAPFANLNADPEVMRHFPQTLDRDQSDALALRIRQALDSNGHGWWALDVPEIGFAGFVGINRVPFDAHFNDLRRPMLEVGWRLCRPAWGHGFATEGALLALAHAFDVLREPEVVSFAVAGNLASLRVMQRIGMREAGEFDHPRLPEGHALRRHLLYRLTASDWKSHSTNG